ncbi:MAG: spore germination protein [Erysipelotrichaceae bacterium]
MNLNFCHKDNVLLLDQLLYVKDNFDVINKECRVEDYIFNFYFIDGFVKDDIMERIMSFLLKQPIDTLRQQENAQMFSNHLIPYVEVDVLCDVNDIVTKVLSGSIAMVVGSFNQVIMVDARTYPTRGMSEPEDDKVLRGSRDGFVETIIFNTALIRRRIRDPHLRMEYHAVGNLSKTDIVFAYLDTKVDHTLLSILQQRLKQIDVNALSMGQESLCEALVDHKWYNPFPKVRYSERPDSAASNILEGKIILIIDNSPSIIILPTTFFDFVQEAQDYYLPPFTGTYMRLVRILVFLLTLFITPVFYLLNANPDLLPTFLAFIAINDNGKVGIIYQFLILEFGIDALKMASLNTPSSLNSSFSIIGALILGDFAVAAGWFAPEVILYMAFVALANFTQPSYELGYAIKFMRVLFLIMIALFNKIGFVITLIFLGCLLYQNRTISKTSYLYPLLPFNAHDFKMIFIREKLKQSQQKNES